MNKNVILSVCDNPTKKAYKTKTKDNNILHALCLDIFVHQTRKNSISNSIKLKNNTNGWEYNDNWNKFNSYNDEPPQWAFFRSIQYKSLIQNIDLMIVTSIFNLKAFDNEWKIFVDCVSALVSTATAIQTEQWSGQFLNEKNEL